MQLDPGKTELSSSASAQGNRRPFLAGRGPRVPTHTAHCASVCEYRGSVAAGGVQLQLGQGEPALKSPCAAAAGLGVARAVVPRAPALGVGGSSRVGAPFGGLQGVQCTLSSRGFFWCSVQGL